MFSFITSSSEKRARIFEAAKILFFVAVVILAFFLGKATQVSPYLLPLTDPIHSINGQVTANNNESAITVKVRDEELTVKITKDTFFNNANPGPPPWPYLFKPAPPYNPKPMTARDIPIGARVLVFFSEDLRTIKTLSVTGTRVALFSRSSSIRGELKDVGDATLTVEGSAVEGPVSGTTPGPRKINRYTILVNSDTEISQIDPNTPLLPNQQPVPIKYTFEDLKGEEGLLLNVYTDKDPEVGGTLTALRIEPFFSQ